MLTSKHVESLVMVATTEQFLLTGLGDKDLL